MTTTNYCKTPECDGEAANDFCKNCRASMSFWRRRGIRAILARRSRLKKYDSRMERVETEKEKGK